MRERPDAVASVDERGVACRWPGGTVESVAWRELRSVAIRTTSDGPWLDDVFLVLAGEGTDGCVVPSEAEGFADVLGRLQQLPGFDNAAVIEAMRCTDDATFPCWTRTGDGP